MFPPSWKIRRRIIALTLAYCAGNVSYLVVCGQDTRLHESIGVALVLLAGSVIGSYIFGAAWDDKNVMAHARRPRRPEPDGGEVPDGMAG